MPEPRSKERTTFIENKRTSLVHGGLDRFDNALRQRRKRRPIGQERITGLPVHSNGRENVGLLAHDWQRFPGCIQSVQHRETVANCNTKGDCG